MDINEIKVKDIMQRNVKMIEKGTPIKDAAGIMRDNSVSSLIIGPDDEGDAFAIITRKDIIEALVEETSGRSFQLVENIMTKPAITVNMNLSVYNCQQLMRMVGVRRLPVVDGTEVIGILSNSDIFIKLVEDIT